MVKWRNGLKRRWKAMLTWRRKAMMTWRNGLKDGENMMKGLNTDEQQWRNDNGLKRWWNEEIGWKHDEKPCETQKRVEKMMKWKPVTTERNWLKDWWKPMIYKLDNWVRETEKLKGTCSAIQSSTCSVPALWQGDTKDRKRMNSICKRKNRQKIGARDETVEGHSIINLQLASILAQPY